MIWVVLGDDVALFALDWVQGGQKVAGDGLVRRAEEPPCGNRARGGDGFGENEANKGGFHPRLAR